MRTLFLGSYGFGNLGDELCLIDAMKAFPSTEVWAFSHNFEFTASCLPQKINFMRRRPEIADIKPERVVLGGGGVGFLPSIRDMSHWMYTARELGAECHIYNIGMAHLEDFSWLQANEVQRVMACLKSCSVRDHMSWYCTKLWPIDINPSITYYPEKLLSPDRFLTDLLPKRRKLVGISVTGQKLMRDALRRNPERVIAALAPFRSYTVIPIVSTVSADDPEEDDVAGFQYFRSLYLQGFDVSCEQFLDKQWWRQNLTPLRLKGIIAELDVIFTQRKHNLIHAIGTKTTAVGMYPSIDDSIARIFFSLRDEIPPNSTQLSLPVEA